ncbi:MAG: HlyD family efflux transporter periplasmic adaptor subunit [Clostridia bacterium]
MNFRKNIKKIYNKHRDIIYIFGLILIGTMSIIFYNKIFKSKATYTVINGFVEKVTDTIGYVVKDETLIDIVGTQATIPIIEQGTKVAKNEIIAIYINSKYEDYLKKMDELDKEIKSLVVDLPPIYSSEINSIDYKIQELTQESKKATSYIKMQEYKVKIDELSYKKVILIGQLSPTGSKIRELIEKRKEFEKSIEAVSDNIKATRSGIVTYKTDGLENIVNNKNILKCNIDEINKIIEKYKAGFESNYGIKIVDNFKAYIIIKEPRGQNDQYISNGKNYYLKLTDKNGKILTGTLIKNLQNEEDNYCIFEINNLIEELIDLRNVGVEVIWARIEGIAVPNNAIYEKNEENIGYVTIVKGGEYVKVPVKINVSSDNLSIVRNLNSDEKIKYNIISKNELKIYDQLIIE